MAERVFRDQIPRNPYKPNTQKHRIYSKLLEGPVLNSEIVLKMRIFNSTDCASKIRRFLEESTMGELTLGCKRITRGKGLFKYQIERAC